MQSPDHEGFIAIMHLELDKLESINAWILVPWEKVVATGQKILESMWVFKCKRYPDGSVKKLEARLDAQGDQQIEGVDYFDSFSLVVQSSTIRLLLILSIILNLETVQLDVILAFVQVPAETNTCVGILWMFELEGYIFELKRNLYGLCEAPCNVFLYLKNRLNNRGLVNSKHDQCLFYGNKVMIMCYVAWWLYFLSKRKGEHR